MISITIDGAEDLFNRLDAVQRNRILYRPMVRSMGRLQADMANYPSPPPRSTYRRSGNYGRSWTQDVQESGDGITGALGNAVRSKRTGRSYGPYVGSADMQASVHAGRWITDELAIERNLSDIERDFADAIENALDG